MQVNKAHSSPAFGGWEKGSGKVLGEIISKFPKSKQSKAISIINHIESNSPHHVISVSDDMLLSGLTSKARVSYYHGKVSLRTLKQLDKFITHENQIIPQIPAKAKQIYEVLKAPGIISGKRFMSLDKISTNLAREFLESGTQKADNIMKKIRYINQQSKKYNLSIVMGEFREIYTISHSQHTEKCGKYSTGNLMGTFDKIYRDVVKLTKRIDKKNAKKDKEFSKKLKIIEYIKAIESFRKKFIEFVKTNEVIQTAKQIKDKILAPVNKFKEAHKKEQQAKIKEITSQLKIPE